MDADTTFRMIFAVLVMIVLGIRLLGHIRAGKLGKQAPQNNVYDEGLVTRIMRPLPVLIGLGAVVYIAVPQWMAWSSVGLPVGLRLLSLPLGVAVVAGMGWVHASLSEHFSRGLEIRADHRLITSGPYRWVRHPMYTTVFLLFVAVFLLTANWFIGLGGLVIAMTVVLARTPKEEAMLIEVFGEAYRDYMRQTPRYLPRLFR